MERCQHRGRKISNRVYLQAVYRRVRFAVSTRSQAEPGCGSRHIRSRRARDVASSYAAPPADPHLGHPGLSRVSGLPEQEDAAVQPCRDDPSFSRPAVGVPAGHRREVQQFRIRPAGVCCGADLGGHLRGFSEKQDTRSAGIARYRRGHAPLGSFAPRTRIHALSPGLGKCRLHRYVDCYRRGVLSIRPWTTSAVGASTFMAAGFSIPPFIGVW